MGTAVERRGSNSQSLAPSLSLSSQPGPLLHPGPSPPQDRQPKMGLWRTHSGTGNTELADVRYGASGKGWAIWEAEGSRRNGFLL